MVYLTATLLYEGKTIHDLSGMCAGSTTIREFIKPRIQRKFASEQLNRHRRLVIRMHCSGDRDSWSTPAKQFQVRSVAR